VLISVFLHLQTVRCYCNNVCMNIDINSVCCFSEILKLSENLRAHILYYVQFSVKICTDLAEGMLGTHISKPEYWVQ